MKFWLLIVTDKLVRELRRIIFNWLIGVVNSYVLLVAVALHQLPRQLPITFWDFMPPNPCPALAENDKGVQATSRLFTHGHRRRKSVSPLSKRKGFVVHVDRRWREKVWPNIDKQR